MSYWIEQKHDNPDIVEIFIGPFSIKDDAIKWIEKEKLIDVEIIKVEEEE